MSQRPANDRNTFPGGFRLALVFCMILAGFVDARLEQTTFFVATTGSDGNPGTQAQPFRTLTKGVSVLTPGATLYVTGGTYAEALTSGSGGIPSGTSWTSPVKIAAYQGATVILRPSSGSNVLTFAASAPSYVVIDGLVLDAANVVFSPTDWGNGVYIGGGAHHIRVQNSAIMNAPGQGVLVVGGGYNEFLNLAVHDNGRVYQLTHGLYIDSSNNLVERCRIYNNAAWGLQVYGGNRPSDNIVRRNSVYNNTRLGNGGGIQLAGARNTAFNNVVWNNDGGSAIEVGWGDPVDIRVLNNTISNRYGIYIHTDSTRTRVQNNIVYGSNAVVENAGTGTIISNNLLANPDFANAAGGDFRLLPTSVAIDAGTSISEVFIDFDEVRRPQGLALDIGAYEYSKAPRPPLNLRILRRAGEPAPISLMLGVPGFPVIFR